MSSKHATDSPAAASWSIVHRLAFLFGISTFAILVLASGVLYWALQDNLEREDRGALVAELQVLRTIVRERPNDRPALEQEVLWEGNQRGRPHVYKRVLNVDGTPILATPGMDSLIPITVFPAPGADITAPIFYDAGKRRFLLATLRIATAGTGPAVLQAALDVTPEHSLLMAYRRRLLLVLLCGVILAAATGAIVAARGLAPLKHVARAAAGIGAHRLSERLDAADWPIEVQSVATAFNAMLGRLEEAFARLGRFSADLAHELRTPINNLMGEAEVALTKPRTPEEYRDVLESALEEYGHLARTIDSLLFLARTERPGTRVERKPLDARAEAESLCAFYEALAQEQGVRLTCSGSATVVADSLLLRRALANLIDNALKHTARGGQIDIVVADAAGAAEIGVSDTGSGIAPEDLPQVFERFFHRCDARGAGLGLALVKSIVELHGGSVAVTSRVGAGSKFILHFPA